MSTLLLRKLLFQQDLCMELLFLTSVNQLLQVPFLLDKFLTLLALPFLNRSDPLPSADFKNEDWTYFFNPVEIAAIRKRAKAAAEKEKQPEATNLGLRIIGVSICHAEGRNLTEQDSPGDPAIMGIVLLALLTEQDRSQAVSLSSQRKRDLIISMASMCSQLLALNDDEDFESQALIEDMREA